MKLAFATVILLLVFNLSFCQALVKPKIGTAISAMQRPLNYYTIDHQVVRARIQGGVAVEIPFKKNITLQPELIYTVKGLRDTSDIYRSQSWGQQPSFRGYLYNFHYLEMPVIVRFSDHNFRLGAGPSIAFLFHSTTRSELNSIFNIKNKYSKLDVGLNIEAAYVIKLFELGTRFTYGLSDVKKLENSNPEIYSEESVLGKNRSLQIYLSYALKEL